MWFLRRMPRILWTDHETNNNVLNRTGTERHLLKTIRKRQAARVLRARHQEVKIGKTSHDRQVRRQERAR